MKRKRTIRKRLALVLVTALVLSQMVVPVSAEDNVSIIQTETQEESALPKNLDGQTEESVTEDKPAGIDLEEAVDSGLESETGEPNDSEENEIDLENSENTPDSEETNTPDSVDDPQSEIIGDIQARLARAGEFVVSDGNTSNMYNSLADAVDYVNENPTTAYTIYVGKNETLDSQLTISNTAGVTITSNSANPCTLSKSSDRIFFVTGKLTLENITLDGGGITVEKGQLVMKDGAVIQDVYANFGGGVFVGNESTFTMTGGKIHGNTVNNHGGGVCVSKNSSFLMTGGEISGNVTDAAGGGAGGVFVTDNSTFTMTGGTIANNTTFMHGGGVYINTGCHFEMSKDAVIKDNTAGNLASNNGGRGGGVSINTNASFVMTGGEISGNEVINDKSDFSYGGGVYVYIDGSFKMSGDSVISGNTSGYVGGGVFAGNTGQSDYVNGASFDMESGTISGNKATAGGGVFIRGGNARFNMNGGTINNNDTFASNSQPNTENGGGVYVFFGTFIMNDGAISDNTTYYQGGGIYGYAGKITMNDGKINGNRAPRHQGGVFLGFSEFTMNDGVIGGKNESDRNWASGSGGGVFVFTTSGTFVSKFTMNGGEIIGNSTDSHGGGIYVRETGSASINGNSLIADNSASNGEGGGIHTAKVNNYSNLTASDYQNLTIADSVIFNGNTASAAYMPPTIAASYTNIKYTVTSIVNEDGYLHPINNYDINYVGSNPIIVCRVTYDANGGSGAVPVDRTGYTSGMTVTVAEKGEVVRQDHTFEGWDLSADGTDTHYDPDDTFIITSDVTLYAQWKPISGGGSGGGGGGGGVVTTTTYTVIYDANNGFKDNTYTVTDKTSIAHTVLSNNDSKLGFVYEGYTFLGWSLNPKDTSPSYTGNGIEKVGPKESGAVITLYAIWKQNSTPPTDPEQKAYTVTYDPNGGEGSIYSITVPPGTVHSVKEVTDVTLDYIYSRHSFVKWNTMPDGSGRSYVFGDEITVNKDITLYAQWVPNVTDKTDDTVIPKHPWPGVNPKTTDSPKTGDTSPIGMMYLGLAGSCFLLIILFRRRHALRVPKK